MSHDEVPHLSRVDLTASIDDKGTYEAALSRLQRHLRQIQQTWILQQERAVLVFEGWDAAGKGGAIRRLTQQLDPRAYQVHPIGAPRSDEQNRHYLYRFWQRIPEPGTLAIFDRSWYGRVLVERVEGFASEAEWQRAYDEINEFERALTADGVRMVKFFIHVSKEAQIKRFAERVATPWKRWKLSPEDFRNFNRRPAYAEAINDMFARTHTEHAPWVVVPGEHKRFARVEVLRRVAEVMGRDVDLSPRPLTPELTRAARRLGIKVPT